MPRFFLIERIPTLNIDAKDHCDTMTAEIPNAFIQKIPNMICRERIVMKITAVLVNLLISECLEEYEHYLAYIVILKLYNILYLKDIFYL